MVLRFFKDRKELRGEDIKIDTSIRRTYSGLNLKLLATFYGYA